jgi:hypothetical protein
MSIREAKGREIADEARIIKEGNLYLVPSQSGRGKYKVRPDIPYCSCPDFDFRRQPCKHIFAVQVTIERTTTTTTTPDGHTTTTTKETVTVKRKTYAQPNWPAYHRAQVNEKRLFLYLLHGFAQKVGFWRYFLCNSAFCTKSLCGCVLLVLVSWRSLRRSEVCSGQAHSREHLGRCSCRVGCRGLWG